MVPLGIRCTKSHRHLPAHRRARFRLLPPIRIAYSGFGRLYNTCAWDIPTCCIL
ncbi:MAG: hypothetical protein RML36_07265 [Anaerolineae bacterium]|nr:hypothetical protein [Anaerolineae bacterium]